MTDDPKQVAEALSRLEAERDRRVLDKIARGDAVLLPPKVAVIGCPKPRAADAVAVERDTQGREIYYGTLREDGTIDPGISRIITGVPRAGRDEDGEPPAAQGAAMSARNSAGICRCPTCRRTFPNEARFHRCNLAAAMPKFPPPQPVPPTPSVEEAPRRYIWTQTRPATEAEPAGAITEGEYLVRDGFVYVWAGGKHLGRLAVAEGEDAAVIARRLLREKTKPDDFYRPLPPAKIYH